jgi:hypothetical protein
MYWGPGNYLVIRKQRSRKQDPIKFQMADIRLRIADLRKKKKRIVEKIIGMVE